VPYRIFDQSDAQREQGYGLSLRRVAYGPLLPLLEISEAEFILEVAVDRKDGKVDSTFIDFVTGEAALTAPYPSDGIRSNRKRLREVIQGKIEIEFNHKLTRIKEDNGRVVATFANGVQVSGDLVVAADGVHSFSKFLHSTSLISYNK
jgi:flavin-dependent dehydrogenase